MCPALQRSPGFNPETCSERETSILSQTHPNPLPIDAVLPSLTDALSRHSRCLLVAQPGAGKTTRAPLAILEHFPASAGRWLLLEPRRVAARLAAGYLADSLGESVGATVGYRVRGESRVSADTRLEVLTQGILTRMLQDDPSLEGVAGILFDEFHERALDADLGLALSLDVQQGLRDDLKLLVMSATLDVDALLRLLGHDTPVIDCPGRAWPVTTHYRSCPLRERDEQHQTRVVLEALAEQDGDLLVFLPGQAEIRRLHRELQPRLSADIELCELHGRLPLAQQQAVLRPSGSRRRIILSTAVAESSVTVPGVRVVVDCGWERVPVFKPRSGMSALETRRVNRASADQRRGRAGREAAGTCYRLWAEEQMLAAHREPEIAQTDLSVLAFELMRWGVSDPRTLPWVTPPPTAAFEAGLTLLDTLGLTQAGGGFSALGRRCARWPTHPRLAALLEQARESGSESLACWIVAWLEDPTPVANIDLEHLFSACLTDARGERASGAWRQNARQWAQRLGCPLDVPDLKALPALLATAFPDRVAQNLQQTDERDRARFKLVGGNQVLLDSRHPLAKQGYLIAVELDGDNTGARLYHATAMPASLLETLFPQTREWCERVRWDADTGRLVGEEQRVLGELVLARRPLAKLSPEVLRAGLIQGLRQRGSFAWSEEDRQTLGRLRLLRQHLGSAWPEVTEAMLLDTLEHWLAPHLDGLSRLEQVDALPLGRFLLESLDWPAQQEALKLAPTHLQVPSGSRIQIDYSGEEPVLAVKLQELFGQTATPTVVDGRVPLLIHLLSPARRPVQVTRDLAGFWANSYFEVRKELKGRYPRHPWPDNPLQAEATARAKKRGT
ncbi:MAG: ATP-dependent helicase HrpB [Pseudomonadales bacterium]|nr:ATP-dependent helicase HrpB [Pseudomonadales bacterium]MCP5357709.1 ATP-dependent helicase HrpB [Pseudomonadales bacterium]